jgi:lipopolysaccharide transport system ATP-binding protein
MSDSVIQAEKLSKRFTIGERESYATFRDAIARKLAAPFRANGNRGAEVLWALRDVSFDVKKGEVVGLIGRNGAGKSTLLKILARITRPTTGWARVRGRIGSLLEVGTGFHPELTGRENIFLSGTVLGMKKAEIQQKFDEIVVFSEVERFLDTPLKRYSSGMQMRLAFAVAAHLEPEILLVDEVLAVGDAAFQKKCLGKMGDVARHGRTIVFVSHQMAQIRRLCQRAIWVDGGTVRVEGDVQQVVSSYETAMARGSRNAENGHVSTSDARFTSWEIVGQSNKPHVLDHLDPVTIRLCLDLSRTIPTAKHGIALYDHEQRLIWSKNPENLCLDAGEHVFDHTFTILPLRPGSYTWLVTLYEDDQLIDSWYCEPELIVATESYQTPFDEWTGFLNLPSRFQARTKGGGSNQVRARTQSEALP